MATYTVTGDDTFTIAGRILNDLSNGDTVTLTYPNDIVTVTTGKNKNSIYAKNETGNNVDVVIRVNRGSDDDRFLNGLLSDQNRDLAAFVLMNAELAKRNGDGTGAVIADIYTLQGGVFTRNVDTRENVEGDTEQAVSIYTLKFALATRSQG